MTAVWKVILLFVRVPVLSVKTYSICPSSSLRTVFLANAPRSLEELKMSLSKSMK